MPPRIPIATCLRASKAPVSCLHASLPIRPFSTTPIPQIPRPKRKHQDQYTLAQARARKAANLSRRAVLSTERSAALGDPVKGLTTPFVKSFDTGSAPDPLPEYLEPDSALPKPAEKAHLNFFLTPEKVSESVLYSERISTPRPPKKAEGDVYGILNDISPQEQEQQRVAVHEKAAAAVSVITALENGSSKDRLRVNIQRCIDMFGRHNTDHILPPKPASLLTEGVVPPTPETNEEAAKWRAGPDTGSSEVQIAILTAKIRTLAEFLETRGKKDMHNKRNLRVLVHRRQKLLQYLRRRERGGPRWQHCIETLGLTEGTWKGEISL
ncbi:hypothetical protein BU16DRAFT_496817 [Lophium mytilinum]|uniref:Ribosomal protein-like protein S15 n=1 Tax=Lophium mytilinum TaxID=390894 RepID=A0A6A6QC02_9PEZI|nr:hypothetical protein BU16DRAFT_496817 [Lophium mytilinum]